MNIYGLKIKKRKITQHLNNLKDKFVSREHMSEQKSAVSKINRKIKAKKEETKKKKTRRGRDRQ